MYAGKHKATRKSTLLGRKSKAKGARSRHATHLGLNGTMKPLKKMNKQLVLYVHKKPYQSVTIATVLSGLVLGWAYMKMKNLFW